MIDTHCHVHDRSFDADRNEVIERARDCGVRAMLTVGEDLADSRTAIAVARRYDLRAAAGIHPHAAARAPDDIATELVPLLNEPGVVALGEIGLDYYYDRSPRDVQAEVLRAQLRVAQQRACPVIFHQRDAFDDFVTIVRDHWTSAMRGVVHCFTGTPEQARAYVGQFGLYLGIGGVVTFANAESLRDAVREVGVGSLILETDCPYLAPVPKRGKRNEPAFLPHVAARLTQVLGIGLPEIVAATDANAFTLFGM